VLVEAGDYSGFGGARARSSRNPTSRCSRRRGAACCCGASASGTTTSRSSRT
jgi:hypothetical protein